MDRLIIKRYGSNILGADPDWVEQKRFIRKADSTPSGWEDVTRSEAKRLIEAQKEDESVWRDSVYTEIVRLQESDYNDYKQAREALKAMVAAKPFNTCNFLEKQKICEWFLVSPSEMIGFYTTEMGLSVDQALELKIHNSVDFNKKSVESRFNRFNKAFHIARNIVDRNDLEVIKEDLLLYNFKATYVELGIEGTMKVNYEGVADGLGFFDYLQGTQNWIDAGRSTFESRLQTPFIGPTKTELIAQLMDILDNGN